MIKPWRVYLKKRSRARMSSFLSSWADLPPSSRNQLLVQDWQQHPHTRLAQQPSLQPLTTNISWSTTMLGNQTTQKKKFQKTTMAANVPKVAIDGTSMMLVRHSAPMVVLVVTSMAAKARAQVHWRRDRREPEIFLGCKRDCFHASMKTKTSSAPMPRMMKMTRTWMKVKDSLPMMRHVLSVRTNETTISTMAATDRRTDPT
mmetsp:Transcript_28014/g.70911  ORF Transcript_28014/g.70911 Transcript_28014/m.70911 type:complete len:202 (+) Transcript_28014:1764-2369(+)